MRSMIKEFRRVTWFLLILLAVVNGAFISGCSSKQKNINSEQVTEDKTKTTDITSLRYQGKAYTVINDNNPDFTESDMTTDSYETYGELDEFGRCTTAYANIGRDLMPTEKRGTIGEVKPSGWQTVKYDNVDGNYLYNRCHLIGYQLTGENANEKNLITGTRYLNVEGMLPFENMVTDYIKETDNHVLYRVTPVFEGDNLVANGVHMEAKSVEDNGDGVLFNVFCFNVQPGISIDYSDGNSHLDASVSESAAEASDSANIQIYILNTNTKKFHKESCNSAKNMKSSNRQEYKGKRQALIDMGYEPCSVCKP